MKVALINTSDTVGGAAIACYRLFNAHKTNGLDVKLLVWEKKEQNQARDILDLSARIPISWLKAYNFYLEKLLFLPHEASKESRFAFSTALYGKDISSNKHIQDADIIHLHWINKGYLSLSGLEALSKLGKPIIWTLHDMWAFTGGCHYSGDCKGFQNNCGNCLHIKNSNPKDLSNKIWHKKSQFIKSKNFHFVTCSQWLKQVARSSSLLQTSNIYAIPNPIDVEIYKPLRKKFNKKITILFQAMNIQDKRKGFKYLKKALFRLVSKYPHLREDIKLLIFGKNGNTSLEGLNIEIQNLGVLKNQTEIINAYQQSDVFIIPSLEDNLPNTIMESMACGVPVVGFDTGGIPEMVDHKINGYIAPRRNIEALTEGIKWVIEDKNRYIQLKQNAREKVTNQYNYISISNQYLNLYELALAKKIELID